MVRKAYAYLLLVMAGANKYIKSKIGEIHGITKPVLVISVLFYLLPEVLFSQVCTPSSDGSIQSLVGTDMNSKEEDADGIYSLDDVEVGGNSEFTLFNENNAQYDPSLSNKNTYLVSENFESFIMSFKELVKNRDINLGVVETRFSPQFLEAMRNYKK